MTTLEKTTMRYPEQHVTNDILSEMLSHLSALRKLHHSIPSKAIGTHESQMKLEVHRDLSLMISDLKAAIHQELKRTKPSTMPHTSDHVSQPITDWLNQSLR